MKFYQKLLFAPLLVGCTAVTQEKPNILWITIEDTSPQFIGCYGNEDASTPVIDELASEGVRFANAFSTGTVCSPSRTAIITGVKTYETGTGNHRSKYPVPGYIKGFPFYMQQAGYYTTNNVKTDYNVQNEKAFIKEAWNESSSEAGWWNRKPGQPFFSVFNFTDSHQSRTMTESYEWYLKNVWGKLPESDRIADSAFEMPPIYNDSPEMRKQFARVYNSIKLTDNEIGELLNKLEKDNLKDSTIIFFYADHGEGMPRGKTNGINYGYRVPFVVWFPEMYKHLSPWGTAAVVTDELVDFSDLAPTLISMAGGEIPEHMNGRILIGENRSPKADHLFISADRSDNGIDMVRTVTNGRFVYSRNFLPFMPEARYIRYMEIGEIKQQMRKELAEGKLNELQKSVFQDRPAEFLFDIENDLWETRNLVNDPGYKSVLEDMRAELKQEVLSSRDVLFLPEYEIGLLSKATTAYEFRLDSSLYPIDEIYQAASLSGIRDFNTAKKQFDLLNSTNKFIRYWAIIGLRSQDKALLKANSGKLIEAMKDTYPPVAVTASAIMCDISQNSIGLDNMKEFCASDNMDLALMAINYLLYIDDQTPFIETIKAVHEMEGRTYNVKAACMDFLGSIGLVPNNGAYRE